MIGDPTYFDVYVNGEKIGTFRDIGAEDEVRIVPSSGGTVPEVLKKFEMGENRAQSVGRQRMRILPTERNPG